MKFSLARSDLSELMGQIQSVVPSKPPLPILSNVLVEATPEGLILTATDLTVGVRCFIKTPIAEPGATTIPSRRFFQLIRELTAANIEVNVKESDVCEIRASSSRFKLNGMNKSDFPLLPNLESALKVSISTEKFREMLHKTSFAVSKDESRYLMTGILLKIERGMMTLVGTDARRLSKSECPVNLSEDFSGEYIIPIKAVDEITKLLDKSVEETAVIYLSQDRIGLETNQVLIISKLLVGTFPDFKSVIPSQHQFEVSMHREELISMLRQISIFTEDAAAISTFTFDQSALTLSSSHHQIGEGSASMPIAYDSERFEIAFNPQHMLDVLRHTDDENLTFKFIDAFSPCVIEDSKSALFVIMPMRRQGE